MRLQRVSPPLNRVCCPLLAFLIASAITLRAQDKIPVATADELPRHSYRISGSASDVVKSAEQFSVLARQVRADIENDLRKYEIRDRAEVRRLLGVLMNLDMLAGDHDAALQRVARIRELQTETAARLMTGLSVEAIVAARRACGTDEARFRAAFREELLRRLRALPWNAVESRIKAAKAEADTLTENVLWGVVQQGLDPIVAQSEEIDANVAQQIVTARYMLEITIPLNDIYGEVCGIALKENSAARTKAICVPNPFALPAEPALTPVVVAIWDTGVDTSLFPNRLFVNEREARDGKDNDGNGFVDDLHGIAFDLDSDPTVGELHPLDALRRDANEVARHLKGSLDLRAAIDSPEAAALKQVFAQLEPDEFRSFQEDMTLYGIYAHGTGVAGIAADGNPFIRLLVARVTFDHRSVRTCPTMARAEREAATIRSTVKYFKEHGVRIVNMSWGQNRSMIEAGLRKHGVGETVEERARLAREIFHTRRDALYEALKGAPEILFVCGSTNFANDVEFDEMIPGSFDLPNLIVVGAVDKYGNPAAFTGYGRNVLVYTTGIEVETCIPGGKRLRMSGVSVAAPGVSNLAAKLVALDPTLTPRQVRDLIKRGAKRIDRERPILLVNPLKSVALLQQSR